MAIVTYEYYTAIYPGMSEADFKAAAMRAENEVRSVIGPVRWATITPSTFGYDVLKDTICSVISRQSDDAAAGLGKGLTSVSNDGYSESYAASSAVDVQSNLHAQIRAWLSGTGLVGAY